MTYTWDWLMWNDWGPSMNFFFSEYITDASQIVTCVCIYCIVRWLST